jgi:putative protein kinase ArgK-like GTPase of G3E family
LTQATAGSGVDELLGQILAHRQFRHQSGVQTAQAVAARQEEFFAALRDELARRLQASVEKGNFSGVLQRIRRGEIDPYRAALEVIADDSSLRTALQGEETLKDGG